MRPLSLLIIVHHSQPLGEADDVVARAVEAAYRPLLEALWAFPKVKLAMRLAGALPDWLDRNDRPFLDRLKALVARGQVEMLGGPHWGAPLHAVPERDAVGQILTHDSWLNERLGARGRAVWLPDGAWDGTVPRTLARAGATLTFLDDGLARGAGGADGPDGWFVAEREGACVGVVPVSRRLSSHLPWMGPRQLMAALQEKASAGRRHVAVSIAGEQLGVHPHSARWCWARERGWIRRLFDALEANDYWLRLVLPTAVLHQSRPAGVVCPTAATPPEFGLSALPVRDARALARLIRGAEDRLAPLSELRPWITGPPWEATLVRYDEANRLHKRTLRTSALLHQTRRKLKDRGDPMGACQIPALEQARQDLFSAQGAELYHSASGGGLLRADLRHRAWVAVLRAERALHVAAGEHERLRHEVADHDCDGQREVSVTSGHLSAVVRPAGGGSLVELGLWGVGNLINTLSRREELWHDELEGESLLPMLIEESEVHAEVIDDEDAEDEVTQPSTLSGPGGESAGDAESITDAFSSIGGSSTPRPSLPVLEPDLDRQLFVDRHRRVAFQDRFLGEQTTLDNLRRGQHPELGDFHDSAWQLLDVEDDGAEVSVKLSREGVCLEGDRQRLVGLSKRFLFQRDRAGLDVHYEITNRLPDPFRGRFAVEINLNLDDRVLDRYLEVVGVGPFPLDHAFEEEGVKEVHWVLRDRHRRVRLTLGAPARLFHYPVTVPVRSRLGYSSGFQGTALVLAWDLSLWGGEKTQATVSLEVETEP